MATKKTEWSVRFEFASDPTEEQLDVVTDVIERYAGIVGGGRVGESFALRFSLKAASSIAAVTAAESIARKALAKAGIDPEVTIMSHDAQTMDAVIAHNMGSTTDALVGLSDIARRHGFSRQRAAELASHPAFPKPTAKVSSGRVWRLVDVERFLAIPRAPGRPKARNTA